jgi:tetratricopeptide (TPR) repeat protein
MDKKHEKTSLDLQRLMQAANLKTKEDFERFASQMVGKTIPSFDKEALSTEEQAQDLVYQALEEENLMAAERLIFNALALDADCVEAFEYLGDMCEGPLQSLMFYRQGCEAARKKLGVDFFKKNKGFFWGLHETRPYMRCLKNCAECLYLLEEKEASLDIYLELLQLNPNDNQGNRDHAGLCCLELGKLHQFEALNQQFDEDATAFHYFNYALYQFIKTGDSLESRNALAEARDHNKRVLQLMLSKKDLPELPDQYGFGDKNEAVFYCIFAKTIWHNTQGAMVWLDKVYNKR